MSNPILQSQKFEQASDYLVNSMLDSLNQLRNQVDRIVRIAAMQAENQQRGHRGESMAYVEADFMNV